MSEKQLIADIVIELVTDRNEQERLFRGYLTRCVVLESAIQRIQRAYMFDTEGRIDNKPVLDAAVDEAGRVAHDRTIGRDDND